MALLALLAGCDVVSGGVTDLDSPARPVVFEDAVVHGQGYFVSRADGVISHLTGSGFVHNQPDALAMLVTFDLHRDTGSKFNGTIAIEDAYDDRWGWTCLWSDRWHQISVKEMDDRVVITAWFPLVSRSSLPPRYSRSRSWGKTCMLLLPPC